MRCWIRWSTTSIVLGTLLLFASHASAAGGTIKQPGNHPDYSWELEPHLVVGLFKGPGEFKGKPGGGGFGPGFRATVEIVDNGFISSINNTVGISFGGDFDVTKKDVSAVIPVVMQWNFWLHEEWSVFGEPGIAFKVGDKGKFGPVVAVGGRWHFNRDMALTLRVGHPSVTFGISFLL